MTEHHFCRFHQRGRVGIGTQSFFQHTGGGAVNGLKHCIFVTDIGTAGSAHTALDLGGFVGDDVAVQIGQNKYLKFGTNGRVDEIGGHNVNVPILCLDLRIFGGNLVADTGEIAVGLFHNIGFGDDGYILFAVLFGKFKGGTGNATGAAFGGYLKVHAQFAGQFDTAGTQYIFTLCVLSVKGPVDVFFFYFYRTDVGIQIQLSAQGYVGTGHGTALGGGGGAFEQNVTFFDGGKSVGRDSLVTSQTVFNGKTLDFF